MMLFEIPVGDKFTFDGATFTRLSTDSCGIDWVREHRVDGTTKDWAMPPTERVTAQ